MTIRPMENKDLQLCTELFLRVFSAPPWEDEWPSAAHAEAYLRDFTLTPGFRGFVAEQDGAMVGACLGHIIRWWSGDEYYVNEFFVDSTLQRQGVGTALLEHAAQELGKEGIKSFVLLTDRGTPAERFYIKHDFEGIDRMVFMHKEL